jgi:beta-lactam-binding protein with PASTA domain
MSRMLRRLTSKTFLARSAGLLLAGLCIAVVMNSVIMPTYTRHNQGVSVPDVTKMPLEEALEALEQAGLRHEIASRRAHEAYPADHVIDQDPSPLSIVKPNRKIYLTINSTSRPKAVVPDVVNMSLRNATIQIENSGLRLGSISYESNRFRNTVLRQSLAEGDTVAKGSVMDLIVSDGLGDRIVSVPAIVGLLLPQAQQALRDAGLRIEEIRFEPTREMLPNTVIRYTPDVAELIEGQAVSLVVSERFDAVEVREQGAVDAADAADDGRETDGTDGTPSDNTGAADSTRARQPRR